MKEDSQAVKNYIDRHHVAHRDFLLRLRSMIKAYLPNSCEGIAWSMPSYWQNTYLIHFQAFKHHVNVYVGPEAVAYLQENYPELSFTKRGFQLRYDQEIPTNPLRAVCQWQLQKYGDNDEA